MVKVTDVPWQEAGEFVNVAETGLTPVIVIVLEAVHPLPSVTVTVYPPASKPPIDEVVWLLLQLYEKEGSPPVTVTDALPVVVQLLFVVEIFMVTGKMTGETAFVVIQPLTSVTVTV